MVRSSQVFYCLPKPPWRRQKVIPFRDRIYFVLQFPQSNPWFVSSIFVFARVMLLSCHLRGERLKYIHPFSIQFLFAPAIHARPLHERQKRVNNEVITNITSEV